MCVYFVCVYEVCDFNLDLFWILDVFTLLLLLYSISISFLDTRCLVNSTISQYILLLTIKLIIIIIYELIYKYYLS